MYLSVLIVFLLLQVCNSQIGNALSYNDTCKEDNCSTCFNKLAAATLKSSDNQFNLQNTFYPTSKVPPVYVIVTYVYDDNGTVDTDINKTWFWSTSTFYLMQPPSVLQFTSLFFTDPEFRTEYMSLTLPMECFAANVSFMQMLTQRLQLFASKRTIYPAIGNDYSCQAENNETWTEYYQNNKRVVKYLVSTYPVLSLITSISSTVTIYYILFSHNLFEFIFKNVGKEPQNRDQWNMRSTLTMIFVLSMIASLYMIILSFIGLSYGKERHTKGEINAIFSSTGVYDFTLLYDVALEIVLMDICLLFSFFGGQYFLFCIIFKDECHQGSFFYWILCIFSVVAPLSIFSVHFTHVVIGFIHNDYHAKSVGLFYGATVVANVVLFKIQSGLYYIFIINKHSVICYKVFNSCCNSASNGNGLESRNDTAQSNISKKQGYSPSGTIEGQVTVPSESQDGESSQTEDNAQSLDQFPRCDTAPSDCTMTITGKFKYNITPDEDDEFVLNISSYSCHKHDRRFFVMYLISSLALTCFLVYCAALYIKLPINSAFDDAPIRLNDLITGLVFVFYSAIIYWLLKFEPKKKNEQKN